MEQLSEIKRKLEEDGVVVIPGFFKPELIEKIHQQAKAIFQIQFDYSMNPFHHS